MLNKMEIRRSYTQSELDLVASSLLEEGRGLPIWLFEGAMGAGKTTLIKVICEKLGVISNVHSPTFGVVNEYITGQGKAVFHFDCYRLKDEEEAMDIGIEEYFDSGDYCFVEWPEKIESLWPSRYFLVKIDVDQEGARRFDFTIVSNH